MSHRLHPSYFLFHKTFISYKLELTLRKEEELLEILKLIYPAKIFHRDVTKG
jgi:hypothetical protein